MHEVRHPRGLGNHAFAGHQCQTAATVVSAADSRAWTADVSADGHTAIFTATVPGHVPEVIRDVRQSDACAAEP